MLDLYLTVCAWLQAASAVKACFAAWTKGQTALLQNIVSLSVAEGVQPDLFELWEGSLGPEHTERAMNGIKGSAGKAWRWVGEMEELAKSFRDAVSICNKTRHLLFSNVVPGTFAELRLRVFTGPAGRFS